MIRYDMILGTKCGEGWQELEPADEGEWVRYEDAAADHAQEVQKLVALLRSASHGLRSYQYGNSATELAEEMADAIDLALLCRQLIERIALLEQQLEAQRVELEQLLSHKLNNDPAKVEWHSPKTVGHLRMQLETIDPNTPIAAVYFVKIGDTVEARTLGVQLSWESINNEKNRIDKNGVRGLALWAHENDGFGPEVLAYLGRAEELLAAARAAAKEAQEGR